VIPPFHRPPVSFAAADTLKIGDDGRIGSERYGHKCPHGRKRKYRRNVRCGEDLSREVRNGAETFMTYRSARSSLPSAAMRTGMSGGRLRRRRENRRDMASCCCRWRNETKKEKTNVTTDDTLKGLSSRPLERDDRLFSQ